MIGSIGAIIFITDSNDERSFTVTYYKNGEKLLERAVSAGVSVTIYGDMGESDGEGRFLGWNTRSDLSGSILLPGSQIKVNGNLSLYAMIMDSEMFAVILPEKQEGFNITANPMVVSKGGSSILSYSLLPSHIDDGLVIAVNGNPMKLDAMKRIHLDNITEDQIVTVSGVLDKREHSISLPEEQIGYLLTSSAEKVHHGESYTLVYTLLQGYKESYGFGIHVNGGAAKTPSGGTLLVADVMDNHMITVTGIEPIEYSITVGKNISAIVEGSPASKATVEDLITIKPDDGYYSHELNLFES